MANSKEEAFKNWITSEKSMQLSEYGNNVTPDEIAEADFNAGWQAALATVEQEPQPDSKLNELADVYEALD